MNCSDKPKCDHNLPHELTLRAVEEFLATGQATSGLTVRRLPPWQQQQQDAASPQAGWAACVLVCSHKLRDKRCVWWSSDL